MTTSSEENTPLLSAAPLFLSTCCFATLQGDLRFCDTEEALFGVSLLTASSTEIAFPGEFAAAFFLNFGSLRLLPGDFCLRDEGVALLGVLKSTIGLASLGENELLCNTSSPSFNRFSSEPKGDRAWNASKRETPISESPLQLESCELEIACGDRRRGVEWLEVVGLLRS